MTDDLARLAGATIAFDLDGTLVDSAPDLIGTLNVILGEEGVAPLALDVARTFIGHGAWRLIERGFAAQGRALAEPQLDDMERRVIAHYRLHSTDLTRPYPGVIAALETLKGAGAKLCVCTVKRNELSIPILEALGLAAFFDAVVGGDAAPAPKPDPRHLTTAIRMAGGDCAHAVMVGDAATDAGAARAAGIPLILVSFGYTDIPAAALEPDILIDHFDQLVPACLTLLPACSPPGGAL